MNVTKMLPVRTLKDRMIVTAEKVFREMEKIVQVYEVSTNPAHVSGNIEFQGSPTYNNKFCKRLILIINYRNYFSKERNTNNGDIDHFRVVAR